jgi:hypothetical protein
VAKIDSSSQYTESYAPDNLVKVAIFSVYFCCCLAWAARTGDFPRQPQGDAWYYTVLAEKIRTFGFLPDLGEIRTYGYPLFLALISFVSGRDAASLVLAAGLVQVALFAVSVNWLSLIVSNRPRWSLAVLAGLLLNPFLIDALTDTLTEGLIATISVLMVAVLIKAARAREAALLGWLLTGAALSAFAFVIRPANVSFIMGWALAAVLLIGINGDFRWRSFKVISIYIAASLAIIFLIIGPQIYHNYEYYSKFTPFPVINLGNVQLFYGVRLWKYATLVVNSTAAPLNYLNPLFGGWPSGEVDPYQWYLNNPLGGMLTIAAHVFNAFNYDYAHVYIYDIKFPSVALSVSVWAIQAIGIVELVKIIKNYVFEKNRSVEVVAIFALLSVICLQIVAIIAVSGVENRFAAFPTAILFVLAWRGIMTFGDWSRRRTAVTIAACVLASTVGAAGTLYMKSLMTTVPLS